MSDPTSNADHDHYAALVERYERQITTASDLDSMSATIPDHRRPPVTGQVKVRDGLFRTRRVEETIRPGVKVPTTVAVAAELLARCSESVRDLHLPDDNPLPEQVDAARKRVCDLGESAHRGSKNNFFAASTVDAREAVSLAAQVAAAVKLAEQRENLLHAIDPESLRRTAAALTEDIENARAYLTNDPIDRELRAGGAPERRPHTWTP